MHFSCMHSPISKPVKLQPLVQLACCQTGELLQDSSRVRVVRLHGPDEGMAGYEFMILQWIQMRPPGTDPMKGDLVQVQVLSWLDLSGSSQMELPAHQVQLGAGDAEALVATVKDGLEQLQLSQAGLCPCLLLSLLLWILHPPLLSGTGGPGASGLCSTSRGVSPKFLKVIDMVQTVRPEEGL